MRPITEKLLKSGLIPQHAAQLLERWGSLDPGASDLVAERRKVTEAGLQKFAEDVGEMLDAREDEPIMKETRLDLPVHSLTALKTKDGQRTNFTAAAYVDEMGRFIVPVRNRSYYQGLVLVDEDDREWRVLEIDEIYKNDRVDAVQLTVEPLG